MLFCYSMLFLKHVVLTLFFVSHVSTYKILSVILVHFVTTCPRARSADRLRICERLQWLSYKTNSRHNIKAPRPRTPPVVSHHKPAQLLSCFLSQKRWVVDLLAVFGAAVWRRASSAGRHTWAVPDGGAGFKWLLTHTWKSPSLSHLCCLSATRKPA